MDKMEQQSVISTKYFRLLKCYTGIKGISSICVFHGFWFLILLWKNSLLGLEDNAISNNFMIKHTFIPFSENKTGNSMKLKWISGNTKGKGITLSSQHLSLNRRYSRIFSQFDLKMVDIFLAKISIARSAPNESHS